MERWNGWGDSHQDVPVPHSLTAVLAERLGTPHRPRDASLEQVLRDVPVGRLPATAGLSVDALDRLQHAHGQSFPDQLALRSGSVGPVPDAVAHPTTTRAVREVIALARAVDAVVVPYGGGTSVVGGVTTPASERPVITLDMRRMERLVALDEVSMLATFGAGVTGPHLEARLLARGLTLGHYPQSFEYSTLGGWVATRSSGQQSLGYGRIEDLFAGGHLETPTGPVELAPFPASAAGPDLRQAVLGSEGRLGVLTEVTVRVRRRPPVDAVFGAFLPSWDAGVVAARRLAQEGVGLSMVRLSTAAETATTMVLAGKAGRVLGRLLEARRLGPGRCLLLVGVLGSPQRAQRARREAAHVVRSAGGVWTGQPLGRHWQRQRFRQPYLRNGLWEQGFGVDTVETATTWSQVPAMVQAVETALHATGLPLHVGSHLSHVYPSGSSVYSTFVFRLGAGADETLALWQRLKASATAAIVSQGGTVSHHHGVGTHHREALQQEKGTTGMALLTALARSADQEHRMNPGKLL